MTTRYDECCDLHWPGQSRTIHELEHQRDALLEAAEALLYHVDGWLTAWRDSFAASDDEISEQKALVSNVRAAIAKARGE